jgi:hypothetical protein
VPTTVAASTSGGPWSRGPAEEWPERCLVAPWGMPNRVPCHDLLVEVAHPAGDSRSVEKVGKAGAPFGDSGLHEARLFNVNPLIELWRGDDAFFERPD